jgi:hypothetical protein
VFSAQSRADFISWQDYETGFSLSYPDTWRQVVNKNPYDVLTIAAPSPEGHAICRASAYDDNRFGVYPPSADWAIQRHAYSSHFWGQFMNVQGYQNAQLFNVIDGGGFGRGVATIAYAEYSGAVPRPNEKRRAVLFASNYANELFVFECSAKNTHYSQWRDVFMSIAKSTDFEKVNHELRIGEHFNFLENESYWNAPTINTEKRDIYFEQPDDVSWTHY